MLIVFRPHIIIHVFKQIDQQLIIDLEETHDGTVKVRDQDNDRGECNGKSDGGDRTASVCETCLVAHDDHGQHSHQVQGHPDGEWNAVHDRRMYPREMDVSQCQHRGHKWISAAGCILKLIGVIGINRQQPQFVLCLFRHLYKIFDLFGYVTLPLTQYIPVIVVLLHFGLVLAAGRPA